MENEENNRELHEGHPTTPITSPQEGFKGINTQKGIIVVFMLTACLCALIGVYVGVTYTTNQCNAQYQEFFSEHYCTEGNPTTNYATYSLSGLNDINSDKLNITDGLE